MAAVPDFKSTAETPSFDASFEPYGRLLRMLMPSLCGVAVHDGYCNKVWTSAEWDLGDEAEMVKHAIANALSDAAPLAGIVRTLDADRTVYSFVVRGEHVDLRGVISLVVRPAGSKAEARPLEYVRQLVQPALECLRRELALRSQLGSRERDLGVRERDLSLMLEISAHPAATGGDIDEFDLVLKTSLEHMNCALAALWIPDKNIALTLTRSGQSMSSLSIARAQQHLTAWMQLQQRIIVVNRISTASQTAAPYKLLACPVRHPSERVMGVLALFNPPSAPDFDPHQTRIAELLAKKATAIIQSQYDCSTGLMTRQAFERQAMTLLAANAAPGTHGILYLDIDRLHIVNETFGMHVGDDVIAGVAECMAKALPGGALSARISGDRLAAFIPNIGMEAAAGVAETIRAAISGIVPRAGQGSFQVSASLGVAPIARGENALAHALATAEIACKAAKDRGRDRVEVFQDSDHSIIRRHTDILVIGQLRDALAHDKFRLDAQPILPLRGVLGRPRFELLIRMLGDRGEIIPPGKFLSAAERYQLMPMIDRWVVQRACRLIGAHNHSLGGETARFGINLSGQSLQDDSFLPFVVEQLRLHKLAANVLCLELTETATMGNLTKAQNFMRTLQDLGCQFALDDFGTGVSSLAYLKELPVNTLKIDGSFVRDALTNSRSESMVKAIAQLAKAMSMETIAEYVETDSLRGKMADLGVDFGQGFAMGKALLLDDLLSGLALYDTVAPADAPERIAAC